MDKKTKKTKSVLMELRPCFAGYSGIPQDTRITYSLFAEMKGVELGGHVLNSSTETFGFQWRENGDELASASQESSYIIALEGWSDGDKDFSKEPFLLRVLRKFRINKIIKAYVMNLLFSSNSRLHELSSERFKDYIWRYLFEKTLNVEKMEVILGTKFVGGSLSYGHMAGVVSKGLPSFKLNTEGWDVYISQTPFPAAVSKNTQLVVRYHDSIPIDYPHLISDVFYHNAVATQTLMMCKEGAWFACNSETTRKNLLKVWPELESRSGVVNCCVTDEFFEIKDESVRDIALSYAVAGVSAENNLSGVSDYKEVVKNQFNNNFFICVGTLEARKNYKTILHAWKEYRRKFKKDTQLVIVGNPGWGVEDITDELNQSINEGDLFLLQKVPLSHLRRLYSMAKATIVASYAEGFSYSGIESMRCKTPVIASRIDVHEEIYSQHASFFNPYSIEELALQMNNMMNMRAKKRRDILDDAHEFSLRYSEENQRKQWQVFFDRF